MNGVLLLVAEQNMDGNYGVATKDSVPVTFFEGNLWVNISGHGLKLHGFLMSRVLGGSNKAWEPCGIEEDSGGRWTGQTSD